VNLDDPLYKQRELVSSWTGERKGFGDYINFATVQMRKKHQAGDETQDEVRIDRKNFNSEGKPSSCSTAGRRFRPPPVDELRIPDHLELLRRQEVVQPWKKATRRGQPGASLPEAERWICSRSRRHRDGRGSVHHGEALLQAGDTEQVKTVTLNASKGQLSEKIDFHPPRTP